MSAMAWYSVRTCGGDKLVAWREIVESLAYGVRNRCYSVSGPTLVMRTSLKLATGGTLSITSSALQERGRQLEANAFHSDIRAITKHSMSTPMYVIF
jgi:hypothetical protein